LQFTYDFTYDEAQQWVINRLSQLPPLPNGAQPQISPESPIGEIYRYRVVGPPGYSVLDLKTIEDWMLERRFKAVPGVIDVTGWGGKTKTYDVTVDLHKLVDLRPDLAAGAAGAQQQQHQCRRPDRQYRPQAAVVRGVGLIHSIDDISNTMLTPGGTPVLAQATSPRHGRQPAAAGHRRPGQ
jgi:cobalt-zinc-cadmium resistance protein CzcA